LFLSGLHLCAVRACKNWICNYEIIKKQEYKQKNSNSLLSCRCNCIVEKSFIPPRLRSYLTLYFVKHSSYQRVSTQILKLFVICDLSWTRYLGN
jgi:hypothetical protein